MRILFPVIRGSSGGDVYFERLSTNLRNSYSIGSKIKYFPYYFQLYPSLTYLSQKDIINFDIIHSVSDYGYPFKWQSKPLVITTHHLAFEKQFESERTFMQKLYHSLLYKYSKSSFDAADKIVAMSEHTKEQILCFFPRYDVTVIQNGIDTTLFKPKGVNLAAYEGKTILLYVGNLITRKGAHLLPQIMEKLDDSFILLYTQGLRTKTTFRNKNMVPLGRLTLSELIDVYNMCDVLLVPSIVEGGFSYAAAEAMACGKPIIASHSSGLKEMLGEDGGYLCSTIEDYVEKIKDLALDENYRHEIGNRNREIVINKYNIIKTGSRYKDLYEEILNEF